MSRCHCCEAPQLEGARRKIVLAGNPNVGKSVFFGAWSGMYVEVSNFPGTTVEITGGKVGECELFDTPGVYGVGSFSDEERVARDVILNADVVVNVADATHLERDLFLTLQLIDMRLPVVVALNFYDEAEALGIRIDVAELGRQLGVTVIPTVAVDKKGLDEVLRALEHARTGMCTPGIDHEVTHLLDRVYSRPEALMVAEGDEAVAARHGVDPSDARERIYMARRERVNALTERVVRRPEAGHALRDAVGRFCLNPITGFLVLAAVLWGAYQVIGVWVASDIVGFTEGTVFVGMYEPWVRGLLSEWTPESGVLGGFLIGEFGLLTMTVTYLFGLLLPLVAGFYLTLSLLEDSGYLPRLAAYVDRMMEGLGLNGRAVIPVILGFGCVQLGTITTRILGSRREKTIATAILNFVIPCSAQIGVIAGMLAVVGTKYTLVYGAVILACLVAVGTVLSRVVPGKTTPLLIDLPPMRLPRPSNVLRKTAVRTFFFMKEAIPWFVAGSAIVTGLLLAGGLSLWRDGLAPLTEGWLGLPREAATAFVMGMVRRDFGAAGLSSLALSPWQTVVSLVVITLFVPCVASLMVLFKERGVKEATAIWAGSWVVAFTVGGILARVVLWE